MVIEEGAWKFINIGIGGNDIVSSLRSLLPRRETQLISSVAIASLVSIGGNQDTATP
jgi:hypothetical protein